MTDKRLREIAATLFGVASKSPAALKGVLRATVDEAVAKERAKCILVVCWMCAMGYPLTADGDYHERPGDTYTPHCKAAPIRRRPVPNPAPSPEKEKAD